MSGLISQRVARRANPFPNSRKSNWVCLWQLPPGILLNLTLWNCQV